MKNDAVLRDEVMEEIHSNPFIASWDIAANAGSNPVRLTGFVVAYAEKYAAETKSYGSKPNSAKPMLRQCAKCRRLPEPESAIEIRQYRKSFTSGGCAPENAMHLFSAWNRHSPFPTTEHQRRWRPMNSAG